MWGRAFCASAVCVTLAIGSEAVEAQERQVDFNIPAGSLDAALRLFARQSAGRILYRPESVQGMRSAGLRARVDPPEALRRLLADTGLEGRLASPDVYVVARAVSAGVQADSVEEPAARPEDDVVVTGSNIRGAPPTAFVRTVTRADIEASGRATVAEVVGEQSSNFQGTGNPLASLTGVDRSSLNLTLAPAADLRGLGSDATLTLFDGRRAAGSGGRGDFSDLSAVPSLAIGRIEILADGASAIYGSDAVGGVVNMIYRRDLHGAAGRIRGSLARGGSPSALASAAVGRTWTRGTFLLAYEYDRREPLSAGDRAYTATGDLRPFGGSDRRTFISSPGTVLRTDPVTRTLVPAYGIVPGASGAPPMFSPGQNFGNQVQGVDLSPRISRHSVLARVERDISSGVTAFAEARFARRSFSFASPPPQTIFVVTAANPYFVPQDGLTSTPIAYSFANDLGNSRTDGRVSALALAAGLDWQIGRGWRIDGHASFARERSGELVSNQVNSTLLSEALGTIPDNQATPFSVSRDGYFNPYGGGSSNSAELLDFIGSGYSRTRRRSSLTDLAVRASGALVDTSSGPLRLAIGASRRQETFVTTAETFTSGVTPTIVPQRSLSRSVEAGFAEIRVPVLLPLEVQDPTPPRLDVVAALRHERYQGTGSTTNPRLGLLLQPSTRLRFRAGWGTSFRAPALPEAGDPRRVASTSLRDATGTSVPVLFVAGGNPELGPERASTLSMGAEFGGAPADAGLRLSINLFRTSFRDRISQPALQDVSRALIAPELALFVDRLSPATSEGDLRRVTALLSEAGAGAGLFPPTAYRAAIDARFVNTGSLVVSGMDADLNFTRETSFGRVWTATSATWLFRYAEQLTPASEFVERLGTLGRPVDLKLRQTFGWRRGGTSASLSGSLTSAYRDDASSPARRIAAFATLDIVASHAPSAGPLRGTTFQLAIQNLLDSDPPFVDRVSGFGFDAANASPFGRTVALELRRNF